MDFFQSPVYFPLQRAISPCIQTSLRLGFCEIVSGGALFSQQFGRKRFFFSLVKKKLKFDFSFPILQLNLLFSWKTNIPPNEYSHWKLKQFTLKQIVWYQWERFGFEPNALLGVYSSLDQQIPLPNPTQKCQESWPGCFCLLDTQGPPRTVIQWYLWYLCVAFACSYAEALCVQEFPLYCFYFCETFRFWLPPLHWNVFLYPGRCHLPVAQGMLEEPKPELSHSKRTLLALWMAS